MKKRISIIIPTYNVVDKISITLDSIKNIYDKNIEVIIIDGGSNDGTLSVCEKYNEYIDALLSENDNGIYDAMNKGIELSKGEFLYFIGAGDEIVCSLADILNLLDGNVDYLYGNCYFKKSKKIYNGKYNQWKISNSNICHQAIFYRKKLFENIGLYEVKYKYFADWWMNLKCFGDENIKKKYVDCLIANYEEGGFSSDNKEIVFYNERDKYIYENYKYGVRIMVLIRRALAKIKNSVFK